MKIVNIILGLGTAIILSSLIHLGIRAFHPEPVSPYQAHPERFVGKPFPRDFDCEKGDTSCIEERDQFYKEEEERQKLQQEEQRRYEEELRRYNRDVFIIANVVGILVFVGGFWILFNTAIASQSVPIGIMIAGLYSIVWGYSRGWNSVDDRLKFFVGLVIAALTIGGSIWLTQRYYYRTKHVKN